MARRSDHTRPELEALILVEGHRLLEEVGFARFSAREVAKRVGYTIGTIYNLFDSLDQLVVALNARTFALWTASLRAGLEQAGADRIAALVTGYFAFARRYPRLWMAIYDHRVADGATLPPDYLQQRMQLIGVVEAEIGLLLPALAADDLAALTRSLVATVHGHCFFELNRTFEALGERDAQGAALARVREALAAAGAELSVPGGQARD
jgi:AcrR family transcriptional regulator